MNMMREMSTQYIHTCNIIQLPPGEGEEDAYGQG